LISKSGESQQRAQARRHYQSQYTLAPLARATGRATHACMSTQTHQSLSTASYVAFCHHCCTSLTPKYRVVEVSVCRSVGGLATAEPASTPTCALGNRRICNRAVGTRHSNTAIRTLRRRLGDGLFVEARVSLNCSPGALHYQAAAGDGSEGLSDQTPLTCHQYPHHPYKIGASTSSTLHRPLSQAAHSIASPGKRGEHRGWLSSADTACRAW
jgi:hypothetical protein